MTAGTLRDRKKSKWIATLPYVILMSYSFVLKECLVKIRTLIISMAVALSTNAFADDSAQQGNGQDPFAKLEWRQGPRQDTIANQATVQTSGSMASLDENNSIEFLKLTHNLPNPGSYIFVSKNDWWADFSYNPMGHVKDDEKIDADEILQSLKNIDEKANERRSQLGLPSLYTMGWYIPPHYDSNTHLLEWGVRVLSEGKESINYTVRLLGREGVMNATLVSDTSRLNYDLPQFKQFLSTFQYNPGSSYSEFKPGDHVAELGLGALIVGGATAVATKKGFWGVLGGLLAASWKIAAGVFVAIGAWLKSLFSKKKN